MYALVNEKGIIEIDDKQVFNSYMHDYAYLHKKSNSKKHFYYLLEFIPELKLFSTFFNQMDWQTYVEDVYDSSSKEKIDLDKKKPTRAYTYINNELHPFESVEKIGAIEIDFPVEYRHSLKPGTYEAFLFSYEFSNYYPNNDYIQLNTGKHPATFHRKEIDDFYYIQLEQNKFLCWHQKDNIENYFISKNPYSGILGEYRSFKIKNICT